MRKILQPLFFAFVVFGLISCKSSGQKENAVSSIAIQLVSQSLKSPSTAQFISTEVLYQKEVNNEIFYIVKTEVDAQNSFGAMIRDQYCVAFSQKKNEEEGKFRYAQSSYIQSCNDNNGRVPSSLIIDIMKTENNFP